ncbi:MAG: hypothetical protein GX969_06025 [Firmicutes bacterium]|nr:hypothetical protein [Bacillota bacterium]
MRKNILYKLAASYIGAVVGAGFASGQEFVQFFFPPHFPWEKRIFSAGLGLLWAGGLFVLFGAALGKLAAKHQTASSRDLLSQLFPWPFYLIYDGLMMFFIFGSLSIMLAGSGVLFKQFMGLSQITGILLMAAFTVLTVITGIDGLFMINAFMSPVMIIMPIIVVVLSMLKKIQGFFLLPVLIYCLEDQAGLVTGFIQPVRVLLYVSYNILLAVGVFASMGKDIPDSNLAKKGGILGGIGLMFLLVAIQSVLVIHGPIIFSRELPMLEAASYYGLSVAIGYSVSLWFAMATTSVCSAFTLLQRLYSVFLIPKRILIVMIIVVASLPAGFGFTKLINTVYPIIGCIGLPVLGCILIRFIISEVKSG